MILQDWDEIEALQESLREHMAEIHRLRAAGQQALEALDLAQALSERSAHHAKILDAYEALRAVLAEDRSADTGETSDHIPDAAKMVEPIAHISGYKQGYCVIEPVDRNVLLPVGMALYRSLPTSQESQQVEPVAWWNKKYDSVMLMTRLSPQLGGMEGIKSSPAYAAKQLVPLYTVPPKREPLTEEQIESAVCNAYVEKALTRYDITIARAIERAHGIGGEE